MLSVYGFATRRLKYDDRGNPMEETCHGLGDELIDSTMGWARRSAKYDAVGNATEVTHWDANGAPASTTDVVRPWEDYRIQFLRRTWRLSITIDQNNRPRRMELFGADGQPCENSMGISRVEFAFNPSDGTTSYDRYNLAGELVGSPW